MIHEHQLLCSIQLCLAMLSLYTLCPLFGGVCAEELYERHAHGIQYITNLNVTSLFHEFVDIFLPTVHHQRCKLLLCVIRVVLDSHNHQARVKQLVEPTKRRQSPVSVFPGPLGTCTIPSLISYCLHCLRSMFRLRYTAFLYQSDILFMIGFIHR